MLIQSREDETFKYAVSVYEEANRQRDAGKFLTAYRLYDLALKDLRGKLDIFILYDMALARDFAGEVEEATLLFEQCVAAFENFQIGNPGDSRIPAWDNFVGGVREQLVLRLGAGSDKLDYLRHVRATPWPPERFPLRVFIDQTEKSGFAPDLVEQIHSAVSTWAEHLVDGGFLYVSEASEADIAIARSINVSAATQAFGGQTCFEYGDASELTVSHATIRIFSGAYSIDTSAGQADLLRFYSLILHEFGHALGLDGHSPYGDDLMYWKSARVDLSLRDIATIKMVY